MSSNLGALLQQQAIDRGTGIALRFKRLGAWEQVSWRDLAKSVQDTARALKHQGFAPGNSITIRSEPSVEALWLFLASQWLGGQARVLNPDEDMAVDASPDLNWDTTPTTALGDVPIAAIDPDAIALIVGNVSSLTTGALLRHAEQLVTRDQVSERDTAFIAGDWASNSTFLFGVIPWLIAGFTLHIPETRATAEHDRREIQPTLIAYSPADCEALCNSVRVRLPVQGRWRRWIDRYLQNGRGLAGSILVRRPLRRVLGLQDIRVAWIDGGPLSREAGNFFHALRLSLESRPLHGSWPEAPVPPIRWRGLRHLELPEAAAFDEFRMIL